jgi:Predicted thioesterase
VEQSAPANELAQQLIGRRASCEMPVRWGDQDALNHVNNAVYFRYLEEARVQVLRQGSIGILSAHRNIVLARTGCDFLRPIVWPATLRIDMKLVRVGRSSLEYQAEIHVQGDDSGPYARADAVIVGTDARTGRSSPWTSEELQGMAQVFASPAE